MLKSEFFYRHRDAPGAAWTEWISCGTVSSERALVRFLTRLDRKMRQSFWQARLELTDDGVVVSDLLILERVPPRRS
jgi:hypothetical protein